MFENVMKKDQVRLISVLTARLSSQTAISINKNGSTWTPNAASGAALGMISISGAQGRIQDSSPTRFSSAQDVIRVKLVFSWQANPIILPLLAA